MHKGYRYFCILAIVVRRQLLAQKMLNRWKVEVRITV